MSMHEVEDLIEDSVRLVVASALPVPEKLALTQALYSIQMRFDTSDTTGRLASELAAIGFGNLEDAGLVDELEVGDAVLALAAAEGSRALVWDWILFLRLITNEYGAGGAPAFDLAPGGALQRARAAIRRSGVEPAKAPADSLLHRWARYVRAPELSPATVELRAIHHALLNPAASDVDLQDLFETEKEALG